MRLAGIAALCVGLAACSAPVRGIPTPTVPALAAPASPDLTDTGPAGVVPPPLVRTGPVSLHGWTLTLPVAGAKGSAATIDPARFTAPWLTRDAAGNLTFWAPASGVTTDNSAHARTELVGARTFAAGARAHALRMSVAVLQVPADGQDVILGQIHGAGAIRSVPFVMLHYTAGDVHVVVKQGQSGSAAAVYPLLSGVPIGARFDVTLADGGAGGLVFAARYEEQGGTVVTPLPAAFSNATVRFQAGAYQLSAASTDPADGARLVVYVLDTAGAA